MIFEKAADNHPKIYHFAFNIPENQLDSAKTWVPERTPLSKSADGLDTFHAAGWDSDGLYFSDPAGNILEFIARHRLGNAQPGEFSGAKWLSISEIRVAQMQTTNCFGCVVYGVCMTFVSQSG